MSFMRCLNTDTYQYTWHTYRTGIERPLCHVISHCPSTVQWALSISPVGWEINNVWWMVIYMHQDACVSTSCLPWLLRSWLARALGLAPLNFEVAWFWCHWIWMFHIYREDLQAVGLLVLTGRVAGWWVYACLFPLKILISHSILSYVMNPMSLLMAGWVCRCPFIWGWMDGWINELWHACMFWWTDGIDARAWTNG